MSRVAGVHRSGTHSFSKSSEEQIVLVAGGALGENVTTAGLDLFVLSAGTRLHLGKEAVIELTGLRNPCAQIEAYRPGLLKRVVGRAEDGGVVRRAGVMSVVVTGGTVRRGDTVRVETPDVFVALDRV